MSQERTRFPIQPQERRRSARSSKDISVAPEDIPETDEAPPDKPSPAAPPRERGEGGRAQDRRDDQDQPDDSGGTDRQD